MTRSQQNTWDGLSRNYKLYGVIHRANLQKEVNVIN